MGAPSLLTELQAVNSILSLIGEAPLNTLQNVTSLDALNAVAALQRAQREILTSGFWFNKEVVTITATADGKFQVPDTFLWVDPVDRNERHFVQRGEYLYNLTDNTFTGNTGTLELEACVSLDWDQLPQTARQAIQASAAKHFAFSEVGEQNLYQVAMANERFAMAELYNENLLHERTTRLEGPALRGASPRWR